MEYLRDPVFGKMHYDYGWCTPTLFSFGKEIHTINCVADAFPDQVVTDAQRLAYQEFYESSEAIEKTVLRALKAYIKNPDNVR